MHSPFDSDGQETLDFSGDGGLEPGDVVAEKYIIRQLVGQGAFGKVYEADDLHLRRRVALKTLYGSPTSEHIRRFRREITLIKSIEHGNVVRLYDFGTDERGVLFMSMEFVEGYDLGRVLKEEGRFEPLRAMGVIFQILDALIEAQKLGVVHRDLKPQNIILTEKGARSDVVKLLDFGLAKAYDDSGISHGGSSSLAAGTPLYMAPEQIRNGPVGAYTDVYAAGLLLLEMLTGVPPFHAESVIDLLTAKTSQQVELADDRIPIELLPIIEKAVRTDYDERYATAREMFLALEEAVHQFAPEVYATARAVVRPPSVPVDPVEDFFAELTPTASTRPKTDLNEDLPPTRRTQELDPKMVDDVEELFSTDSTVPPTGVLEPIKPPPSSVMRRPRRKGRTSERQHTRHVTARNPEGEE